MISTIQIKSSTLFITKKKKKKDQLEDIEAPQNVLDPVKNSLVETFISISQSLQHSSRPQLNENIDA